MKKNFKYLKFLKKITGIFLIILGILGLFLPLIQGIALIILGSFLLGNKKLTKLTKKYFKKIKKNKKKIFLPIRYIIILILTLFISLIYKILMPLTIHTTSILLKLFYSVQISKNFIIINGFTIEIIPACVAGSAYILLLILNLMTPMKTKQRIYSLSFSITTLFILNIIRIFILSLLFINNSQFFDIIHKLIWYLLSTILVVIIWFVSIKLFKIKNIPAYTDIKFLLRK